MNTSTAAHKHDWRTNERRSCLREELSWIVLVFFGQNNWGKLIDLSERGMRFQFEQPPSLKEPIDFTFEAMGCMSIPQEASAFGDSFQAAGRVVWTHEFERTAGVQFLNLSQRNRDQIRHWVSSATGQGAAPVPDATNVGHTAGLTEELKREWDAEWNRRTGQQTAEPFASKVPLTELPGTRTQSDVFQETSELKLEELDSRLESLWQAEPTFTPQSPQRQSTFHREPEQESPEHIAEPRKFDANLPPEFEQGFATQSQHPLVADTQTFWRTEPEVTPQNLETPPPDAEMVRALRTHERLEQNGFEAPLAFEAPPALPHEGSQRRGATLRPKPQKARVGYVIAVTCLGTLLVAAALIEIATRSAGRAGAGEVASLAPESRVDTTTDQPTSIEGAGPFIVEVLDTSSRRSVLWFTGDSEQDISTREVQRPALSAASAVSRDPILEERPSVAAKHEPPRDFTLASPHPVAGANTSAAGSEAVTAPTFGEAPIAGDVPLRTNLPIPAAPVERTLPVGGDVQPARLIRAVLPAYPQLAKSQRVAGDVTLDALIDASGNVRDVSAISGPVFLREAAKIALKQWKYEPARLDGQPTAMHLTVTVKFKNDQK
ncbi:MAG TPA: TonB family protein [Candidatus Acidoferrum sp.]|nr:TonB family protein [Candidatus Acidoferrum sp.]